MYILRTYNIHTCKYLHKHTYLEDKHAYTFPYIGFMDVKPENIIFLHL